MRATGPTWNAQTTRVNIGMSATLEANLPVSRINVRQSHSTASPARREKVAEGRMRYYAWSETGIG